MRLPVPVVLLSAALCAGLSAVPASAATAERAPSARTSTAAERAAIKAYWTPDRMAKAVPAERLVEVRPAPGREPAPEPAPAAGKPTKPSSGTVVTGATWTGGGQVVATTGKVFFTLAGTNYVCSGSVVDGANDSTVLTAGHCAHEGLADGTGQYASQWVFVPAYDGGSTDVDPHGSWPFVTLQTTEGWATKGDFDYDVAFATVDDGDSNTTLESVVGKQQIEFSQPAGLTVHAFGYPQASPYDGTTLTYCAGTTSADPYGYDTQGLPCNMTGGSSGGPWYTTFADGTGVAYSVNSYRYTAGRYRDRMFGPKFGEEVKALFDAVSATAVPTSVAA